MTKLLILFLLISGVAMSRPHKPCPSKGNSGDPDIEKLDKGKNRKTRPTHFNSTVTLDKLLAPGKDSVRFGNSYAAKITGYIVMVEDQDGESCNCDSPYPEDHDFHVYFAKTKNETVKKNCVVVEITPYSKKIHPEWTKAYLDGLKGKEVTVGGWMLYDWKHRGNAVKYTPDSHALWRNTCWEIHPVTSIEAL